MMDDDKVSVRISMPNFSIDTSTSIKDETYRDRAISRALCDAFESAMPKMLRPDAVMAQFIEFLLIGRNSISTQTLNAHILDSILKSSVEIIDFWVELDSKKKEHKESNHEEN